MVGGGLDKESQEENSSPEEERRRLGVAGFANSMMTRLRIHGMWYRRVGGCSAGSRHSTSCPMTLIPDHADNLRIEPHVTV